MSLVGEPHGFQPFRNQQDDRAAARGRRRLRRFRGRTPRPHGPRDAGRDRRRPLCRDQRDGRPSRQAGEIRPLRLSIAREPRAAARGCDLPHRLDDQADGRGRHADPLRGGQVAARRSRDEIHARVRRSQGHERRWRPRSARPANADAPRHVHLGRLRLRAAARQRQSEGRRALCGGRPLERHERRPDRQARQASARSAAGHAFSLRPPTGSARGYHQAPHRPDH